MSHIGRRAAAIAATTVFGLGVFGTAAFAALTAAPSDTYAQDLDRAALAGSQAPKGDHLKDVLDALVAKGVITQQQEAAIIAAFRDQGGDRERAELVRRIFAGLMAESAKYLGMQPADLRAKLPTTSLGAVANATPGKSRDGLVADLVAFVNTGIDKAVADGKLTQAQADKIKLTVPARVAKFVDHVWPQPAPKAPSIRAFIGDVMSTARDYIGISQKDLVSQLRDGKSLAEIAVANGKTRDGLVSALTTSGNAKIDKAVADGKLTAAQATQLKSKLAIEVGKIVDRHGKTPSVKSH